VRHVATKEKAVHVHVNVHVDVDVNVDVNGSCHAKILARRAMVFGLIVRSSPAGKYRDRHLVHLFSPALIIVRKNRTGEKR